MTLTPKLTTVNMRLKNSDGSDDALPTFDFTKLSAINTCPTWGVLRYEHHKTFSDVGRSMALEAGSACHDVFAALRVYHLLTVQHRADLAHHHGLRLFGAGRFNSMLSQLDSSESERTRYINFCLDALSTSGFYDDPRDKRRTLTNLEEAVIFYADRWRWNEDNIWIRDSESPTSDVGIETPFDVVVEFTTEELGVVAVRYTGKMDGLHVNAKHGLVLHENKTAARLNDAWKQSFMMSHQVTGYCAVASLWSGEQVNRALVLGLAIPLPKSDDQLIRETVYRDRHKLDEWFKWFWHTYLIWREHKDDPSGAPKYTHSCNRYFRPCLYLPYCDSSVEDRVEMYDQMVTEEWSPLHEVSSTKYGD